MPRRNNSCRCCCQWIEIVRAPLEAIDTGYVHPEWDPQSLNCDPLVVSSPLGGTAYVATDGGVELVAFGPTAFQLYADFFPATLAVNGDVAPETGGILVGQDLAHDDGSVSVTMPSGAVAESSVTVGTVNLPEDMYSLLNVRPVNGDSDDNRYAISLSEITPFFNPYASLSELDSLPRDGIEEWGEMVTRPPGVSQWVAEPPLDDPIYRDLGYTDEWWEGRPLPEVAYYSTAIIAVGSDERIHYGGYSHRMIVTEQPTEMGTLCVTASIGDSPQMSAGSHAGVEFKPTRSSDALPGYTDKPVKKILGQRVTLYRDGDVAMSTTVRPTETASDAATQEDGSYFVVSVVDEDSDETRNLYHGVTGEGSGVGNWPQGWFYDARWRSAKFTKDFAAFVVDARNPSVGFAAWDDIYSGFYGVATTRNSVTLYGTEPIRGNAIVLAAALQVPVTQGTHTVTVYDHSAVFDRAGNRPHEPTTTHTHKVWPRLQPGNRVGPIATLLLPGESQSQQLASVFVRKNAQLLAPASSPMAAAMIVFNRTVVPAGDDTIEATIAAAMSLTQNGDSVGATFTVTEVTPNLKYSVAWEADQPPRAFFLLTFAPDGSLVADDDTADPCQLAARASWLMADDVPSATLIDVASSVRSIGGVASVTEMRSATALPGRVSLEVSGGVFLQSNQGPEVVELEDADEQVTGLGRYRPIGDAGFVPEVPALTSPADRSSFWELGTTIDPCPPGFVSGCGYPSAPQKHASAIRCDGDITTFEVRLVPCDGDGNEIAQDAVYWGPYFRGGAEPEINFPISGHDTGPEQWRRAIYFSLPGILALNSSPLHFTAELEGHILAQNNWYCGDSIDGEQARMIVYPVPTWAYVKNMEEGGEQFVREGEGLYWLSGLPNESPVAKVPPDLDDYEFNSMLNVWQNAYTHDELWTQAQIDEKGLIVGAPAVDLEVEPPHWQNAFFDRIPQATYTGPANDDKRRVRMLQGTVSATKALARLSASRAAKVFTQVGTATLGELVLSLNVTFVLEANLHYEDREREWPTTVPAQAAQVRFWTGPGPEPANFKKYLVVGRGPTNVTWGEMTSVGEQDVVKRQIAGITDALVLSQDKEQALAEGEEITVPANTVPNYLWKIKKG